MKNERKNNSHLNLNKNIIFVIILIVVIFFLSISLYSVQKGSQKNNDCNCVGYII